MPKNMKGYTLVELLICLWFLVCLAGAGTMIYIIYHFVTKYW